MTPTEQDRKLEVALMELFCRSEEFGRVFLTCAPKEEFAKSVNGGALDHQQAAHEAMQLITADRKRVALEAKIEAINYLDDNYQEDSQNWERDHPGYSTAMIPLEDYARYRNELGSQLSKSKEEK